MTLEIPTYTDSALNDLIKDFFNRFKENNQYKYVNLIDSEIISSNIIKIDYNDFNKEIKEILDKEPIQRVDAAITRAIGEIFQTRYGSEELEKVKQAKQLKFKLVNFKDQKQLQQIEDYLNTRIKKDPILVKQLVRTFLSTYTDNPINIALLAPSSDGKTYATVEVSKIFPKEDIILVGRMSPTALIHQNGFLIDEDGNNIDEKLEDITQRIIDAKIDKDKVLENEIKKERDELIKTARRCVDLTNKILLFLDNPQPQTYEMLKPIMSHDSKEIQYMTTKGDGSLNVSKSVIRGWPVFIFCSAKNEEQNEVWEEIKTRVFMTSPNSDIEKYKEANQLTALKFSRPTWAKSLYTNDIDKEWSKYCINEFKTKLTELCKDGNNPIINPFNAAIADKFPHTQGVSMRHLTRLMSFINLETLLNSEYNPGLLIKTKDDKFVRSIFTTINDIDNACKVLKNISTISPEKIKFYDKIFTPCLNGVLDASLTSSQLAEKYTQVFKKPVTVKQITENYLKPLVDSGILATKPNPVNASSYLYEKVGDITIHNLSDLKSTLIDTSTPIDTYIDSCLRDLEEVSIEIGKSYIDFDIEDHTSYYLYCQEQYIHDSEELKDFLLCNSRNQSTLKEANS